MKESNRGTISTKTAVSVYAELAVLASAEPAVLASAEPTVPKYAEPAVAISAAAEWATAGVFSEPTATE